MYNINWRDKVNKVDKINAGDFNETFNNIEASMNDIDTNKPNKATTLSGYGITDAYTKYEINQKISGVYTYKGSKDNYTVLPMSGNVKGDVWNVTNEHNIDANGYLLVSMYGIGAVPYEEYYEFTFDSVEGMNIGDTLDLYVGNIYCDKLYIEEINGNTVRSYYYKDEEYLGHDGYAAFYAVAQAFGIEVIQGATLYVNNVIYVTGSDTSPETATHSTISILRYPAGTNFAWNGEAWDALGGDLSKYYTKPEVDTKIDSVKSICGSFALIDVPSTDVITLHPNTVVRIAEIQRPTTINLAPGISGRDNEWCAVIQMDSAATFSISLPVIQWTLGIAPTFAMGTTTEIRLHYVGDTLRGEWSA